MVKKECSNKKCKPYLLLWQAPFEPQTQPIRFPVFGSIVEHCFLKVNPLMKNIFTAIPANPIPISKTLKRNICKYAIIKFNLNGKDSRKGRNN